MESKQIEAQVGKVLCFKPQVGKVKTGQTTGGFIDVCPLNLLTFVNMQPELSIKCQTNQNNPKHRRSKIKTIPNKEI